MGVLARIESPVLKYLLPKTKFQSDFIWNLASFGLLATSGIIINLLISLTRGVTELGIFNQAYAIFVVLSQFAVIGIHLSVLKHLSWMNSGSKDAKSTVAVSAVVLAALVASIVCVLAYVGADFLGELLSSPQVASGVVVVLPGLFCFSLNKVLLNVLNALHCLKSFAVFQALRYVFILVSISALLLFDVSVALLPACLSIAEVLLLIVLFAYVHCQILPLRVSNLSLTSVKAHWEFGIRGCFIGILGEINTRVDILMLGFFMSDAIVGIYSFAALFAEGLSQLPFVLRRNIDPILGNKLAAGEKEKIETLAQRVKKVFFPLMLIAAVLISAVFPFIFSYFLEPGELQMSSAIFVILMIGIVYNSRFRPFSGIITQGGRPGAATFFTMKIVGTNIVLNVLLIPILGIYGAAVATSLAFLMESYLIARYAQDLFSVKI